jgi:hypothetical protein
MSSRTRAEARRAATPVSDAALVDAAEILVRADPPDQLVGLIQAVSVGSARAAR